MGNKWSGFPFLLPGKDEGLVLVVPDNENNPIVIPVPVQKEISFSELNEKIHQLPPPADMAPKYGYFNGPGWDRESEEKPHD